MYTRILVAIEHSDADRTILTHIERLAKMTGASLLLVHVADGWAARHFFDLNLRESEEMRDDRAYLSRIEAEMKAAGLEVASQLALGDPADALARVSREAGVDLIAMATHGHRFIKDLFFGATADRLRHLVDIPVLLLKAR